jgi:hypothetical protein
MTCPVADIEVECPACGERFVAWHRGSVNLSLGEKWTKKELDEVEFVNCPRCNRRYEKEVLVASIVASRYHH